MTLESIGALWLKEKNGKKFMSGSIEEEKIVFENGKASILMYKNDYKTEERHPDYKLMQVLDGDQPKKKTEPKQEEDSSIPF